MIVIRFVNNKNKVKGISLISNYRIKKYFVDKLENKPELVQTGDLIKIFHHFIKKHELKKVDKPKIISCFA